MKTVTPNYAPKYIARLREDLSAYADKIATLFRNPLVTIIVRDPNLPRGTVVLTQDSHEEIVKALADILKDPGAMTIPPDAGSNIPIPHGNRPSS